MIKIKVEYVYKREFSPEVDGNVFRHNHSCYELVYFVEGEGSTTVNSSKKYVYSSDCYAIYAPFAYHDEIHKTKTVVKGFGFSIEESECPLIPELGLFGDKTRNIKQMVNRICDEMDQKKAFYDIAMNAYLCNLLILHCRNTNQGQQKEGALSHVIAYIDENYLQEIELQEIAKMSGYSYDRFRHLFKKITGVSPKNYILHKRIAYAKRLLAEENQSVTEIAYQCRFSSAADFGTSFRQRVGVSPSQYRKTHANKDIQVNTLSQNKQK